MTLRCASRDHVPQSKPRAKYDARSASAMSLCINMRQSVSARLQAHSWPRLWQVIDGSRPSVVEFATVHFIKELLAASVTWSGFGKLIEKLMVNRRIMLQKSVRNLRILVGRNKHAHHFGDCGVSLQPSALCRAQRSEQLEPMVFTVDEHRFDDRGVFDDRRYVRRKLGVYAI